MARDLIPGADSFRLRAIALFEAAKGLLVLAVGGGLLSLLGGNVQATAEKLISLSHLNPASPYPRLFIESAGHLTDAHLCWMAVGALGYSTIRLVETVGLWQSRSWAAWIGALSGGIYLPLEIAELTQRITPLRLGVLAVNLAIVSLLGLTLWQRRRKNGRAGSDPAPAPPR